MYMYILDALFRGWYSSKNIKRNVLYPFPAERQQKLNIISGPVRGILLFTSPHNIVHWEKTEPVFLNWNPGIDSKE
jgi:hypothetical protein